MINENIGGHATVHHHLRQAFADRDDVVPTWLDAPPPGPVGRLLRAPLPGLAAIDADLQPLRAQLVLSARVRRAIRGLVAGVDAVHLYTQNAGLLSAGHLAGKPLVVSTDTTNVLNGFRLPYRRPGPGTPATIAISKRLERRVFAAADRIVANSAWAARSLRADYCVPDHKMRVFPFGVTGPPAALRPQRSGPPVIGFVGRQFDRKGGPQLVDAFLSSAPEPSLLCLVSPDPRAAAAAAVSDRISVVDDLVPGDPRLWDLLAGFRVFAFPSTIDQAPNAVVEAMAAGLPVVGADQAAVSEMVLDGESGLLVPPGDAAALGQALRKLVDDPMLSAAMGSAGRARFESEYRAEVGANRLLAVIREAMDR